MTGKAATTSMVLAVAMATASSAAQQPVFRGGIDLVNFGVFVTDKAGTPLNGLKAEDFEVIEDGARRRCSTSPAETRQTLRPCISAS